MALRPETGPKNASPRSGTQTGDLEQYGVWVKAEPQDVIEDVALPDTEDSSFDLPLETSPGSSENFLSEDEEKLLDSFDKELDMGSIAESSEFSEDSGPLPDIEDMPPLEEGLDSFGSQEQLVEAGTEPQIDIHLEEHASASSFSSINPNVEIDMSSVEGLDSQNAAQDSQPGAIEDVSSEFLDDFASSPEGAAETPGSESSAPSPDLDDVTAEFLDLGEPEAITQAVPDSNSEFEPLDIDLHFDNSEAEESKSIQEKTESTIESVQPESFETRTSKVFDDVSAVEQELAAIKPEKPVPSKPDLSTEILLKIADELSSIKGELVSLKSQIGGVVASIEANPKKEADDEEGENKGSGSSGGFFDDEEDETIALTGDELDNILNTADFTTEEAAADEAPLDFEEASLEAALPPDENNLLEESLLPENGDYETPSAKKKESPSIEAAAVQPEQEILPETEELSLPLDESLSENVGFDDNPAIEELRVSPEEIDELAEEDIGTIEDLGLDLEEGVTPATQAPEDTSYLESPASEDLTELEGEVLTDAPLVEPDLSDFDLGPDEFEPRPEIDEELPLASNEPVKDEIELEELTLDIDAGEAYSKPEEEIANAEIVEPLPEIEEPDFSEISLHEESQAGSDIGLEDFDALGSESTEPAPLDIASEINEEEEDLVLAVQEDSALPEVAEEQEDLVSEIDEVAFEEPEAVSAPAPSAPAPAAPAPSAPAAKAQKEPKEALDDGDRLKSEIKSVLSYLDKLLDSLPEEKIEEFARSKYFDTYKKLFEELGLV